MNDPEEVLQMEPRVAKYIMPDLCRQLIDENYKLRAAYPDGIWMIEKAYMEYLVDNDIIGEYYIHDRDFAKVLSREVIVMINNILGVNCGVIRT